MRRMDILTVAIGALCANFLTVAFLYVCWRLNRPGAGDDVPGIAMGIAVCGVIIAIALAARLPI